MNPKPSTAFDRWIESNAGRIAGEPKAFQKAVAFASLYLKMIEKNRNGFAAVQAEAMTEHFAKLKAEFARCGMEPPAINLPKIKVVRPRA